MESHKSAPPNANLQKIKKVMDSIETTLTFTFQGINGLFLFQKKTYPRLVCISFKSTPSYCQTNGWTIKLLLVCKFNKILNFHPFLDKLILSALDGRKSALFSIYHSYWNPTIFPFRNILSFIIADIPSHNPIKSCQIIDYRQLITPLITFVIGNRCCDGQIRGENPRKMSVTPHLRIEIDEENLHKDQLPQVLIPTLSMSPQPLSMLLLIPLPSLYHTSLLLSTQPSIQKCNYTLSSNQWPGI